MAEMDRHQLALAYDAVVSSGVLQNSHQEARNTSRLNSCEFTYSRNSRHHSFLRSPAFSLLDFFQSACNGLFHSVPETRSNSIRTQVTPPLTLATPLPRVIFEISNNKFSKNTEVLQWVGRKRLVLQLPNQEDGIPRPRAAYWQNKLENFRCRVQADFPKTGTAEQPLPTMHLA